MEEINIRTRTRSVQNPFEYLSQPEQSSEKVEALFYDFTSFFENDYLKGRGRVVASDLVPALITFKNRRGLDDPMFRKLVFITFYESIKFEDSGAQNYIALMGFKNNYIEFRRLAEYQSKYSGHLRTVHHMIEVIEGKEEFTSEEALAFKKNSIKFLKFVNNSDPDIIDTNLVEFFSLIGDELTFNDPDVADEMILRLNIVHDRIENNLDENYGRLQELLSKMFPQIDFSQMNNVYFFVNNLDTLKIIFSGFNQVDQLEKQKKGSPRRPLYEKSLEAYSKILNYVKERDLRKFSTLKTVLRKVIDMFASYGVNLNFFRAMIRCKGHLDFECHFIGYVASCVSDFLQMIGKNNYKIQDIYDFIIVQILISKFAILKSLTNSDETPREFIHRVSDYLPVEYVSYNKLIKIVDLNSKFIADVLRITSFLENKLACNSQRPNDCFNEKQTLKNIGEAMKIIYLG